MLVLSYDLFAARVHIWPCPEILCPHWWMTRPRGAGGDGVIWEGSCHLAAHLAAQPEFKLIRRCSLLLQCAAPVWQVGEWRKHCDTFAQQ